MGQRGLQRDSPALRVTQQNRRLGGQGKQAGHSCDSRLHSDRFNAGAAVSGQIGCGEGCFGCHREIVEHAAVQCEAVQSDYSGRRCSVVADPECAVRSGELGHLTGGGWYSSLRSL